MSRLEKSTGEILQSRLTLLGRGMIDRVLTDEMVNKAYARLDEGLDAKTTKVFQREGEVIYSEPLIDFTERREAAKEILRIADHYPAKLEHEVSGSVEFKIVGLDPDKV